VAPSAVSKYTQRNNAARPLASGQSSTSNLQITTGSFRLAPAPRLMTTVWGQYVQLRGTHQALQNV
jgi:hypothetical protein